MNFDTRDKIFLWCNHGYGDALVLIPIINNLLQKYQNQLVITLGVHKKYKYLFEHLNIKIIEFDIDRRDIPFDAWMPDLHHSIYAWLGHPRYSKTPWYISQEPFHWKRLVKIVNAELKRCNLPFFVDEGDILGEVKLPERSVNVKNNTIFVENGECLSNQNDFHFDVCKIAEKYHNFNFICTSEPKFEMSNIDFNSSRDLIDYQNLLKKCIGFIGKGSGPVCLTFLQDLQNIPKALFGYKHEIRYKLWDDNFSLEYHDGSYDSIYNFIEKYFI